MKLLLDTCTLLWAISDSKMLPNKIKEMIDDADNEIYISFTSLWEIEIKHQKNKESMPFRATDVAEKLKGTDVEPMYFDLADLYVLEEIIKQNIHKDPFDHMLLAMAKTDNSILVTHDKNLEKYQGINILSY